MSQYGLFCIRCTWLASPVDWTRRSLGLSHRRQVRPHPMHTGGYIFVSSRMHRRPPPKSPIKGCVLPSKVIQSLALESSTSQNFSFDQPLDYAVASSPAWQSTPCNCSLFHYSRHFCCIISRRIIIVMSPGLTTTSHRLSTSTEWKNHK